ncbi:MAG: DEAD/DEAH box helicase [Phycisphaerae bacterium]|nr:DEAD/DEAH box helicase [Phycisphaerae bacterium]
MLALHGIWWRSRFHVWREQYAVSDSSAPCVSAPEAADDDTRAIDHPAALPAAELHAIVGDISPDGLLASIADESSIVLWLPCENGVPLPSTCGATGAAVAARARHLCYKRVKVPTLAFSAADTIDLLLSLAGPWLRTYSDSLRYWRRLATLMVSLLAAQQFVPDVEALADGAYAARWRVFLRSRRELAWLERYAAAMPPVCRAVVEEEDVSQHGVTRAQAHGPSASPVEPAQIVDSFLLESADAVIRRNLSNDPFFGQIHRRAAAEGSWELRWLSGLVGETQTIRASAEDDAAFVARVRSWIGRLEEDEKDRPPALSFTLIEPDDAAEVAGARWHVRFDLHSGDEGRPLDISRVWAEGLNAPTILGRHLVNRREQLLAELARAADVFPALKRTPASGAPVGVALTTSEAHMFLHEWAPMLRAQGYGVTLPAWTNRDDRRLGIELFVRPTAGTRGPADDDTGDVGIGSLGLSSMLAFDWRVAVGDEQVSLHEFERITAENTPLVKIHGHWVDIDNAAAQQALAFVRDQPRGQITLAEAVRLASGAEDLDTGLPIVGLRGTSWIERLLSDVADARIEALGQPPAFHGELRPYQQSGLDWLAFLDRLGIGACLADDMGLGKTIELIALLLHERREEPRASAQTAVTQNNNNNDNGEEPRASAQTASTPNNNRGNDEPARAEERSPSSPIGPTLLFAPMSVVGNWEREIQRFAPSLRVMVHHGSERVAGAAFAHAASKHDVVITTYGLAQRDLGSLRRVQWHRVALDEAQKIKNPSANQTLAIRSLRSGHRVALTGTPVENHLSELWSIMETLNPGLLGPAAGFRKRFAIPIEKLGDRERAAQLRRMIRPFVLRRLKSDPNVACDLPEKMEMRVYCNLTPEQAAHYERMVNALLDEVDSASGIRRRGLILATLTKLKQVCNHPSHLLRDSGPLDRRSGKCERLVEMLEEVLEEGDAALVFTQFREMGDLLVRLLTDRLRIRLPFLHGGTSAKERNRMIVDFQDPSSQNRVFLLSLKAGGFGLNLTKANHVFHFDRWWNPAVEDQATDRAHRIGQIRRVQVHKFVCIGTIEDRIDQLLAEKAALANQIIGSGDDWLTGLSTRELRDYLRLSGEAVAET